MQIPLKFASGDKIVWDDVQTTDMQNDAITSSSYTLKYYLVGAASVLTLTAAANGSGWRTTMTAVQSAALAAGKYTYAARAENGTSIYTLGTGQLEVTPNVSTQIAGSELRTQARIDYDNIVAAIRSAVSNGGIAEYSIGGRTARKYPLADLIVLRDRLKLDVIREEKREIIAAGLGDPSNVYTRFRKNL